MEIQNTIAQLWEKYGQNVLGFGRKIIIALIIVIAGKFVIRLSRRLIDKAVTGKLKADETLTSMIRVVIHYGIIVICLIMILDTFGISTASLIALLGAAGVAIGFALRDTLSNIASGIVILVLKPFKKGDSIECGSVSGVVREMKLFATRMETGDGIPISVPNSSLWGLPLRNFSRSTRRRMSITFTISYSDSVDAAFQVLRDIIGEESRFMKDPAPQIVVQSLNESGVGISLNAWVQSNVFGAVYSEQLKNIKEKIQEAGLTLSFPQRGIQMVKN